MKVLTIAVIGWMCQSLSAQEKVCSTSCNTVGIIQPTPGKSCSDIYVLNKATRGKSDNYWINTDTGIQQVYCNMELDCGGHKGGWMRIANFNISRGDDCPSGWTKITSPVAACIAPSSNAGCYSTHFSTLSIPYSKVCGMAVGYQHNSPDAFGVPSNSINGRYVDGVSITSGSPRNHIWTFAIGYSDKGNFPKYNCPCAKVPGPLPPSFVRDNYYCESGSEGKPSGTLTDDPVWDGKDCSDENSCCSEHSLPWFYRQLPLTTSEDIETRICRDQASGNENILVTEMQLYVQ